MSNYLKFLSILAICFFISMCGAPKPNFDKCTETNRLPEIYPDYTETVIPANIAPMNFKILEPGKSFYVQISSEAGGRIEIASRKAGIRISAKAWKKMLNQNRSKEININIYVLNKENKWTQFSTIKNRIAEDNIDPYLVYRIIHPGYQLWTDLMIKQRNVENFKEKTILHNKTLKHGCINCHTFCNNSPDKMIYHIRGGPGTGMILANGKSVKKINTKTKFNGHTAYAAWHPGGKTIAFSVNKVTQFFHAVGENKDVLDIRSDLVLYEIETNTITSCPAISDKDWMETYPAWSPDGKYLYYCNAPLLKIADNRTDYKNNRYSLMRIPYNIEERSWGEPEVLISADETNKTAIQPRVSPDGRYLLINLADYGNFATYCPSSDLHILDLQTGKYFKPEINSDRSEGFHNWSSNGRWIVFSSKRGDGVCARIYFSYMGKNGKVHKPFILPQKDPEFYDTFLRSYNLPELLTGPTNFNEYKLTKAAYDIPNIVQAKLDPEIKETRSQTSGNPWKPAKN